MRRAFLTASILVMLSVQSANAACNAASCFGIGAEATKSVYPTQGKTYLEVPSTAEGASLNCTLVSGLYMTLDRNHDNYEAIIATIVTAIALDRHLQVRIAEGSSNGSVVYVRMEL